MKVFFEMNPISLNEENEAQARRMIWFEPPAQALEHPIHFMACVMGNATPANLSIVRRDVPDEGFREALDHAPPGVIDPRSWAYWNSRMARYPAPPMPRRHFA